MCGVCGIADFSGRPLDAGLLKKMVASLTHRGPDDNGTFMGDVAALGHTRLSILDLSPAGHQPMRSPDDGCVVALNGEIYNFRELRSELEQLGHTFIGHSDTEVVLHGYLQWGVSIFGRLNGMFALALFDQRSRELHLARDRFGIKPLYYLERPGRLVFASEIKAILAAEPENEVDWAALGEFLHYGTSLGERTLFKAIRRLPPGKHLRISERSRSCSAFASAFELEPCRDDFETAARRVRELLEQAVKRQLVADVPVGVFLSGGIDSTAIAAFAARHYPGRLRTISAGFDFAGVHDERPAARKLAESLGTDHLELYVEGRDLAPVVEALVRHHDVPFGDAANVPLYLMSRALGRNPTVVLQGDGGDEIFAGYGRYARLKRLSLYRLAAEFAVPLRAVVPSAMRLHRQLGALSAYRGRYAESRMARIMSQEDLSDPPERVLSAEVRELVGRANPFSRYLQMQSQFSHLDPVQRMLYTDTAVVLPDVYFEKVDRATMAFGIEARVPMLDNDLAAYAMSLPSAYKVRGSETKRILRKALVDVLPSSILQGRKLGFNVPFQSWLQTSLAPYMRSVLLDEGFLGSGVVDRTEVDRRVSEHLAGKRDHGYLLWKLLNLALWYRFYIDGRSLSHDNVEHQHR